MVLYKILIVLACIILYPILVAFGPSIFLTLGWISIGAKAGCCCCICSCILFPIPFAIGLILDICWVPLAIIGLPTLAVVALSTQFAAKMENKQIAMQRIQDIIENNRRLVNE